MTRRYVVFVSSTFRDLETEREMVMRGLLSTNCIPAGMEHFPAGNDETFDYIKKIIDDYDYYLLILAGKYGTCAEDGISYTEKEFDYALSKGIPVIALPHRNLGELTGELLEQDVDKRAKLEAFRKKVSTGRIVKYWGSPEELVTHVVSSLHHAKDNHPRPGLLRGRGIQVFNSADQQQEYFLERISRATQVHDLTWATFGSRIDSQHDSLEYEQRHKIALLSSRDLSYDEIFVFFDGMRSRPDRLKKLRDHYQEACSGARSKYSCSYYDSMTFPRLQYTVIDHSEILFTSGQNMRCVVYEPRLAEVFTRYFDQAWDQAKVLIENGRIIEEEIIVKLLEKVGDE